MERGAHVLVAVSGGADSVALLHGLRELVPQFDLTITVAHLNHGIRGEAANRDAEFVRRLAAGMNTPYVAEVANVSERAGRRGESLEMAARAERYRFLSEAAKQHAADCVATAHTADDQAETIVLRVARGTGLQGLSGIPYVSEHHGVRVVRPLLAVSHGEAVAYLRRRELEWREDATNRELNSLRNRVRHEILPLLSARLNPAVRDALVRLADVVSAEMAWTAPQVEHCLNACRCPDHPAELKVEAVAELPKAAARRVVQRWLHERGVPSATRTVDQVDRVLGLTASREGTRGTPLAAGYAVVRRYRRMAVKHEGDGVDVPWRARLHVPGETLIPERGLCVRADYMRGYVRPGGQRIGALPAETSLDRDAVGRAQLVLRSWRAGDRMAPLGMRGSKKLQDVFVDRKVPRDKRAWVPVLECRGQVVWLPGYTVARGWEPREGARQSVHISLQHM